MKHSISAIIPNYNYAKFLPERISSILSQTYPISELIILDDASTDNSVEVIDQEISSIKKSHPSLKVKFIKNTKNSGSVFSQWQKGISEVTSDYFWIAEADDSCDSRFLETIFSNINDQVVLAYTDSKMINIDGTSNFRRNARQFYNKLTNCRWHKNYTNSGIVEIEEVLCVYNTIPNVSAVVFKYNRQLLSYLDEAKKYRLAGDWYFYYQILQKGDISYIAKKLNYQRIHKTSVTKITTHKEHLEEIKSIHLLISQNNTLSAKAKKSMQKYENYLKKIWRI